MELKGRTVLVTGAAKRVGKAVALAFARAGCDVVLHYNRSEAEALQTQKEVKGLGVSCALVRADLADHGQIEQLFKKEEKTLSKVSVLVNSASVFPRTPVEKIGPADWDAVLRANLLGPFYVAQKIGLRLKEKGLEGAVINVTDISVIRPHPNHLPYCASKAALADVTRSLALELAPHVRANSVAPGAVQFPEGYSEDDKKKIVDRIPLRRAGDPSDVANACLFLAKADYVNGTTLVVDGGIL